MRASALDPTGRPIAARRKADASSAAAGTFESLLNGGLSTAGPSAAAPLASLAPLLDLGITDDSGAIDPEAARQRGSDLLDLLDRLKLDLLDGAVPPQRLAQLSETLERTGVASGDINLDALLGEIELRAQVEIAKLSRPS